MPSKRETTLNIEDILSHRNCDGNIYFSDVSLWLGDKIDLDTKRNIWKKLNELKDVINGKN